jgi:C-terminal processing protease CtpA/Prc
MTMKKTLALLIPALALGLAPASVAEEAKEPKKRCKAEASSCIRQMAEGMKKRGWIGIEWQRNEDRPTISHVVKGSPAAAAVVEVGDVVMAFNRISTAEEDEVVWAEMKSSLVPGKIVTLSVLREGKALDLDVELVAVPDHILAQWVGKHVLEHHADESGPDKSP